jgi:predicted dinucleotide-binding enzyme
MNIGIIGPGNMGASMGKSWASKGQKVLFSYSKVPGQVAGGRLRGWLECDRRNSR